MTDVLVYVLATFFAIDLAVSAGALAGIEPPRIVVALVGATTAWGLPYFPEPITAAAGVGGAALVLHTAISRLGTGTVAIRLPRRERSDRATPQKVHMPTL